MKSAQKVNGISVSGPPKIGERPYPSPFHPVEIRGKSGQNSQNQGHKAHNSRYNPPQTHNRRNKSPQNPSKVPFKPQKYRSPGPYRSLEIGTDEARPQVADHALSEYEQHDREMNKRVYSLSISRSLSRRSLRTNVLPALHPYLRKHRTTRVVTPVHSVPVVSPTLLLEFHILRHNATLNSPVYIF